MRALVLIVALMLPVTASAFENVVYFDEMAGQWMWVRIPENRQELDNNGPAKDGSGLIRGSRVRDRTVTNQEIIDRAVVDRGAEWSGARVDRTNSDRAR